MGISQTRDSLYEEFPWVKWAWKVALVVIFLLVASCSFKRVKIEAGHNGVVIGQPMFFGSQGIQKTVYKPGSYWFWKTNGIYEINVLPQQQPEKFDDMMSSDNIPVDFDAFLNFQITDPVNYVANWGERWYGNNVQQAFRTIVREECKRYRMTDLVSNPDVPNKIEQVALAEVQKFAKEKGLPFVFTRVNVGKINPNADVMKEIAQTAVQQQRQRTEGERKKAEDMRAATEKSRAAADNAYREAMNLAPEQYIRLEAVKAYSHAAEECAKNEKCTMILTQPESKINGINVR